MGQGTGPRQLPGESSGDGDAMGSPLDHEEASVVQETHGGR